MNDPFPTVAEKFLSAFYNATNTLSAFPGEKIEALKKSFSLQDAVISCCEPNSTPAQDLHLWEFYILTKLQLI